MLFILIRNQQLYERQEITKKKKNIYNFKKV